MSPVMNTHASYPVLHARNGACSWVELCSVPMMRLTIDLWEILSTAQDPVSIIPSWICESGVIGGSMIFEMVLVSSFGIRRVELVRQGTEHGTQDGVR